MQSALRAALLHSLSSASISQSAKSLQRLQELIRESVLASHAALGKCEMLEHDAFELRKVCAVARRAFFHGVQPKHAYAYACVCSRASSGRWPQRRRPRLLQRCGYEAQTALKWRQYDGGSRRWRQLY